MSAQSANSLDAAVASATASTVEATGLGAYTGFHVAIVSSTVGAAGQIRYCYNSAGRTDVMKVSPEWDTVPAVNDDLSVAKNQDDYNSDYGNKWKLVLKATEEWDGGDFFDVGSGSNKMVFGMTGQGVTLDDYFRVYAGSFMALGYVFGDTSLGGWYFNSNNSNVALGYQFLRVDSSATFFAANTNLGTVYAHQAIFQANSTAYFYDASFSNLMYNGFRLKGNVYGQNLKLQGKGISNDYIVVASTLATFDGPLTLSDSYGFISSATTETIRVRKYNSVNALRDVTANNSTTWEFENPTWVNPEILWTQAAGQSTVSEIFTFDAAIQTTAGSAIASAAFTLTEGSATDRETANYQISNASGLVTDEILKRFWASSTASTTYGPFTGRAWKYGLSPFEGAYTVDAAIDTAVAMGADSEVTETTAASAITKGTNITVREYANPLYVVEYASGGAITVSAVVSGVTSGNQGRLQEKVGSTDGVLVVGSVTGTFTNDEDLYVLGSKVARANVSGFDERYTWEMHCGGEALAVAYDYQQALFATNSATVDAWVSTARQRSTQLLDTAGGVFTTEAYFSTGVWATDRGAGTIGYMTSDAGTQYVPPAQYTFELTGLKTGTEVRIFASATKAEIDGVESSGATFAYNYTYGGSDIDAYVVVFHLDWKEQRIPITLSNENQSIPIQQSIDRAFSNP